MKKPSKDLISILFVPCLLLISLALALSVGQHMGRVYAIENAESAMLDSGRKQSLALDSVLSGQFEVLETLAAGLTDAEIMDPSTSVTRIRDIAKTTQFHHFALDLPNGDVYLDTGDRTNIQNRKYFQKALAGERAVEVISEGKIDTIPLIILAVPVTRQGEVVAIVHGSYLESSLRAIISTAEDGQFNNSFICDQNGKYIVCGEEIRANSEKENFLSDLDGLSARGAGDLRLGLASGISGLTHYSIENVHYYAVYVPLNITDTTGSRWYLFSSVSGEEINRQASRFSNVVMPVFIVIMVTTFLIIMIVFFRERKIAYRIADEREQLRIRGEQYRIVARQSDRHVFQYHFDTKVLYHDQHVKDSLYLPDRLENAPEGLMPILLPESRDDFSGLFTRMKAGEEQVTALCGVRVNDSVTRWYQIDATAIRDGNGKLSQAILSWLDVTENREKEIVYDKWRQSLRAKDPRRFTLYECNFSRQTFSVSVEGTMLDYAFDSDAVTFDDRTLKYVEDRVYSEDKLAYADMLKYDTLLTDYYRGVRTHTLEYREIPEKDAVRWLKLTVELVEYPKSSEIKAYLLYEDIDERKREEIETKTRSETDPLTGVNNREAFSANVDRLLETSAAGAQHAFIMLDVDNFKKINDTYGHAAGDNMLLEMIGRARMILRHDDLIGRFGGDEFVICLRDVPYDAVIEKRAAQICEIMRNVFSGGITSSASIGVSVYPRDGETMDDLLKKADCALYNIKNHGKDGFCIYRPEINDMSGAQRSEMNKPVLPARKMRILIVDDDETQRAILSEIFKNEYTVIEARDGATALLRMRRYGLGISVVLLDLFMPGMDGFDVMTEMRKSKDLKSVPVIVVSADSETETSLRAIECGASDFITKPVDPMLIRLRVKAAISKMENERLRVQNSYLMLQSNEETRYRTVLESTGTVVIEHDWVNSVYVYDAAISEHIAGTYDARPLWRVLMSDMVANTMDVKAMQHMVFALANDRQKTFDTMKVMLKTNKGEKHWFRMNVFKKNDEFMLANKMIITFNDIHEEATSEERLRNQAERDALTGRYNRQAFIERAEAMIRRRPANSYVMSIVDLDNFKVVNDMYGHAEGDKLLIRLSNKLQEVADRNEGLCGRMNADVFAMLLPNDPYMLENLNGLRRDTLREYPLNIELFSSAGRYLIDDVNLPVDAMIDRASLARKTVKDLYGDKVAWYDENLRARMLREQQIVGSMEAALIGKQFTMFLQPKCDLITHEILGAEALVRWKHPERGLISPGEFIPVFERNGFILRMDEYMWREACVFLRAWIDKRGVKGAPSISVNISRVHIHNPSLCSTLSALVERYQIPPRLLELEITESVYSEDPKKLLAVIAQLQKRGFIVEMDDFGSGYSSLNILKDIPVDVLKLDMKFLGASDGSGRGESILASVMQMALRLNIPVIAEGVETEQQAAFLRKIGCQVAQGYLFYKPVPAADFEGLMNAAGQEDALNRDGA